MAVALSGLLQSYFVNQISQQPVATRPKTLPQKRLWKPPPVLLYVECMPPSGRDPYHDGDPRLWPWTHFFVRVDVQGKIASAECPRCGLVLVRGPGETVEWLRTRTYLHLKLRQDVTNRRFAHLMHAALHLERVGLHHESERLRALARRVETAQCRGVGRGRLWVGRRP